MTRATPATAVGGQPSDAGRSPRPGLWWLSPAIIPLVVAAAAILPTAFTSDQTFRTSWRSPKSVTNETLVMFGCGAAAVAFGALLGIALASHVSPRTSIGRWPSLDDRTIRLLHRASTVLTIATVLGYAGFLVLIARAGISPAELFGGSDEDGSVPLKDRIGTVPGVTTLTQLGIAAVVVSTTTLTQRFSRRRAGQDRARHRARRSPCLHLFGEAGAARAGHPGMRDRRHEDVPPIAARRG